MRVLYRAVPADHPYFGQGSYWSASPDFARHFAGWAHSRPELAHLGEYVIYRAELDLTAVMELADPVTSDVISACTSLFVAEGYSWIAFAERGSVDGLSADMARLTRTTRQYVYLGQAAISAERWVQS
jgi:hypothetical protein